MVQCMHRMGSHYHSGHPVGNVTIDVVEEASSNEDLTLPTVTGEDLETVELEVVARLRKAGLLF